MVIAASAAAHSPSSLAPAFRSLTRYESATMATGSHPSWSNLLHLRFYSGNNLRVRRNVPMFYIDLWPACAHPKIPLHLCYQKNSDCPTATGCALDLVGFEQGGEDSHSFFSTTMCKIRWNPPTLTQQSTPPPRPVRRGAVRHGLCRRPWQSSAHSSAMILLNTSWAMLGALS